MNSASTAEYVEEGGRYIAKCKTTSQTHPFFAVFEGDDTTTNLHTALDPYKEHVSEMQIGG